MDQKYRDLGIGKWYDGDWIFGGDSHEHTAPLCIVEGKKLESWKVNVECKECHRYARMAHYMFGLTLYRGL